MKPQMGALSNCKVELEAMKVVASGSLQKAKEQVRDLYEKLGIIQLLLDSIDLLHKGDFKGIRLRIKENQE